MGTRLPALGYEYFFPSQDIQDLGWRPYVLSWIKNLPKEVGDVALKA